MGSELVFHKLQFGKEVTEGVPVAATVIFPSDVGAVSELDRGAQSPDEDYGGIALHRPGRAYYGTRGSKVTIPGEVRFEDIITLFDMHFQGGVTPTGSYPTYTWVYTSDETSDSLKPRTIEEGTSDGQAWQIPGALINDLTLEYSALAIPGASPWKFTANVIGWAREPITFTGALSAPSNMETAMGHLTTLAEGSNGVAFAALPELSSSLIMYKLTSNANLVLRAYGNSTQDRASAHGRKRHDIKFEALVKTSATVLADIWTIFDAVGPVQQERRWRVKATGSGTKSLIIDHRVRFTTIPVGDRDGERVYHVQGEAVYDPTLVSQVQLTVTNTVAVQP